MICWLFQWYLQSAERGFPAAQLVVGDCYREGRGVEKNEAEAMKWYDLAAKTGIVFSSEKIWRKCRAGICKRNVFGGNTIIGYDIF